MPKHESITLDGVITDIFAHRFVLETATTKYLADLGPKGAAMFTLERFAHVTVTGERRPSEIKVLEIGRAGKKRVRIDDAGPHDRKDADRPKHKKKHHEEDADEQTARAAVTREGYEILGLPRQKPKHFEFLGRRPGKDPVEVHVRFDGTIHKTKDLPADGGKWADDMPGA